MPDFTIVTVDSQPILYVHRTSAMTPEAIGACMAESFGILMGFMGEHGIAATGAPMAIYHDYSESETTFDVAVPVTAADAARAAGHADVKGGATQAGRALKTVHVGPYTTLSVTYDALMAHMGREGLTAAGPCREVYRNDPDATPEAELVTEIYFPLA